MKSLIVYFSYSGNTRKLVDGIEAEFPFPLVEIERETPYSPDYDTCAYHEAKEEWEKRACPKIKSIDVDISDYGRIYLFFPIWWYTYPMVIETFAKEHLEGYNGEVIVFANSHTNSHSYMETSLKDLNSLGLGVAFKEGLFNKSLEDHLAYLKKIGE